MRKQRGYATASVLALTALLSLGASIFLDAALTESRRVEALVQRSEIEFALEAAFYDELSKTLNSPRNFKLGQLEVSVLGRSFDVRITDEQSRPDLFRDDIQDLEPVFREQLDSETAATLRIANNEDTTIPYLSDLGQVLNLSSDQTHCVEEHFTLYRSTLNPLGRSNPSSLDGAIIRYKIATQSNDQPARTLRAIVLITGDMNTPYHIMDWSYGQDRREPICPPI